MAASWRRWLVTAAVVAVIAVPVFHPGQPDGFPLSTYPMFASARGSDVSVATAVGIDESGDAHRLDPVAIGGTDEVMLAATTVARAVRSGEAETARLCAEIAGRVADEHDLVAVELRSETHDAIAWFDGDRDPSSSVTHARCDVTP